VPDQPLLYILQHGKLAASLFVLVLENGVWTEPSGGPFDTSASQEPFGAGGTRIHFDAQIPALKHYTYTALAACWS
jgi:hypothetical protein